MKIFNLQKYDFADKYIRRISEEPKKYYLTFTVKQNNICSSLSEISTNKMMHHISSGNIKINVTKKTVKYNTKLIIPIFFEKIDFGIIPQISLTKLVCPTFLKRKLFIQISKYLSKNKEFFFVIESKKSFNGCRVKKLKRKKRASFRVFK